MFDQTVAHARFPSPTPRGDPPAIGFLYVGGAHQVCHTAPVAAALAQAGGHDVTAYAGSAEEADAFARIMAALGAGHVPVRRIVLPPALAFAARHLPARARKTLAILAATPRLARLDAIVTAERTSSFLAAIPAGPRLIHIPHGAGDRARGFEPRIRRFDHVIVAGNKDRARMIAEGVVQPDRCTVSGYLKLEAVRALHRARPTRLFANDRPTVLYNPHFAPGLSSWHRLGAAVIDAFAAQDRYNLIVAPHVRLFEHAGAAARAAWEARAVPDRIHVDLGSPRSCDMTYSMLADVYLGDVSSQVYEFATDPRPCLFLNPHGHAWRDDPNFACWRFGPVLTDVGALLATLDAAPALQPGYASVQRKAVRHALGETAEGQGAAHRAAGVIAGLVHRPAPALAAGTLIPAG